jgi:hypothetical protein
MTTQPCLHPDYEQRSTCCGGFPNEWVSTICDRCAEHAGFEFLCVECDEPMPVKETARAYELRAWNIFLTPFGGTSQ